MKLNRLACSLLTVAALVSAQAATFSIDGITYTTTGDTTVTVSKSAYTGAVTIPGHVEQAGVTYRVTAIDSKAFYQCTGLTAVTLPETIEAIGSSAFYYCTSLTAITIPPLVTAIADETFNCCASLSKLRLNEGLTSIGVSAFEYNAIDSLVIPESVKTLGNGAFGNCPYLAEVHIPKALTSIADYAFYGDTGLKAFTVADDNAAFAAVDGLLMNKAKNKLIAYPNAKSPVAVIPQGVKSLANGAFWACAALERVELPSTLTNIGQYCFWSCEKLTRIALPEGLTTLNAQAFMYCTGLDSVVVPNTVRTMGQGVFYGCESLTGVTLSTGLSQIPASTFQGCSSLGVFVVPEGVTSIGRSAFAGSGLQEITFSSTLKTLGSTVFYSTPELRAYHVAEGNAWFADIDGVLFDAAKTTLVAYPNARSDTYRVPAGTTAVGDDAFSGCTNLVEAEVPATVTSIGEYAFGDCSALRKVTLGSGVTAIGDGLFDYCRALTEIHARMPQPPAVPATVFNKVDRSKCKIYVPVGYGAVYRQTSAWNLFTIVEETVAPSTDLDGNGFTDINDLNITINAIFGLGGNADVDGNGIVDVADMNIVIDAILGTD